jgi:quinone-modifying oxidoreductase subunit QmoC
MSMSQAVPIKPDLDFASDLIRSGGSDLKKCFQCATCSAVCELSPEDLPFPRKEMIWAQWGLKDRLLTDPDVWLCHHCNDCSISCPRGANPGDVLAAVRNQVVRQYAVPRFLAQWVNRGTFLPLMLVVPVLLLLLALWVRDPLGAALGFSHHAGEGMEYANLYPHWLLIGFFTFFLGLAVLIGLIGIIRYWKAMAAAESAQNGRTPAKPILSALISVLTDVFTHRRFNTCNSGSSLPQAHLSTFYGFIALFLVSAWAVILLYILNPFLGTSFEYPFAFWNPAKIIANLGALALVVGCFLAIRSRVRAGKETGNSSEFDWIFLWTLMIVGVTGILTEILRFLQSQQPGYVIYFIHLVFAFMLLTYLPYSKFAHIFYRTAALVYAEQMGRRHPQSE